MAGMGKGTSSGVCSDVEAFFWCGVAGWRAEGKVRESEGREVHAALL